MENLVTRDELIRPITFYIEEFIKEPDYQFIDRRRVTPLYFEMTKEKAQELIRDLQKRLDEDTPGAIRIHAQGRLVLS